MDEKKEGFTYEYSAKQQKEIREIRARYEEKPTEQSKMDALRKLDASVARKGTIASIIIGIISCLVLGTGLSMVMVWGETLFLSGIAVGIVGLLGITFAYPVFNYITKKQKEKIAPEILRLTDELLKE
jgi:hypothetical protein